MGSVNSRSAGGAVPRGWGSTANVDEMGSEAGSPGVVVASDAVQAQGPTVAERLRAEMAKDLAECFREAIAKYREEIGVCDAEEAEAFDHAVQDATLEISCERLV